MTSERRSWRAGRRAGLVAALALAGCADTASMGGEREYLDARTAATVTVGTPTLVLARDRPERAVHARDYLSLAPVDVNRSGRHARYWIGYAWSTLEPPAPVEAPDPVPSFELVADGRRIPLVGHAGPISELGLGAPPVPRPARTAVLLVAPVSPEQQAFVAAADEVYAVLVRDGVRERYELWRR